MKKTIFFLICAVVIITAFVCLNLFMGDKIAATINDMPISEREFMLFLDSNRAWTYNYFKEKYNVDDSKDFWTTQIEGEIPAEAAKSRTLEQLIRLKLEQGLFVENDILDDPSYKAFLIKLRDENNRRREAVSRKQVIYGPEEFDERGYYEYLQSNNLIALKSVLSEKEWCCTDEDILEFYNQIKESEFKRAPTYNYIELAIGFNNQNSSASEKIINEVKIALENGDTFENQFEKSKDSGLVYRENEMNSDTAKLDAYEHREIYGLIAEIEVGGISGIIKKQGEFSIIKVINIGDGQYAEFSEVREAAKRMLEDRLYEEKLQELIESADIKIF